MQLKIEPSFKQKMITRSLPGKVLKRVYKNVIDMCNRKKRQENQVGSAP